jgi:hypothetical protein
VELTRYYCMMLSHPDLPADDYRDPGNIDPLDKFKCDNWRQRLSGEAVEIDVDEEQIPNSIPWEGRSIELYARYYSQDPAVRLQAGWLAMQEKQLRHLFFDEEFHIEYRRKGDD